MSELTKLTYNSNVTATLNNNIVIGIPDGYVYNDEATGLNYGWAFVVSKNTSVTANHIDGKPYSFGLTRNGSGRMGEMISADNHERFKNFLAGQGAFDPSVNINTCACSSHCFAFFQNWTDNADATYNKANGLIVSGENIYQFHAYANHNSEIAYNDDVKKEFYNIVMEWLSNISFIDDFRASKEDVDEVKRQSLAFAIYFMTSDISSLGSKDFFTDEELNALDRFTSAPINLVYMMSLGCNSTYYETFLDSVKMIYGSVALCCIDTNHDMIRQIMDAAIENKLLGSNVTAIKKAFALISDIFSIGWNTKEYPLKGRLDRLSANMGVVNSTIMKLSLHAGVSFSVDGFNTPNVTFITKHEDNSVTVSSTGGTVSKAAKRPNSKEKKPKFSDLKDFEISGTVIRKYKGNDEKVVIPEEITEINYHAFNKCECLKKVIIPDNVVKIGSFSFSDCANLTSVTIGDGVTEIDEYAFSDCRALTNVTIGNGVKNIGDSVFSNCSNIKKITIPSGVISLGRGVFWNCNSLKNVTIEKGVKIIGNSAFYFCRNLEKIIIPESVTEIDNYAFSSCDKVVINTTKNSYAHKYAKKNHMKFELI